MISPSHCCLLILLADCTIGRAALSLEHNSIDGFAHLANSISHAEGRWNSGQDRSVTSWRNGNMRLYPLMKPGRWTKQDGIWKRSTDSGSHPRSKRSIYLGKRMSSWSSPARQRYRSLLKLSRSPATRFMPLWSAWKRNQLALARRVANLPKLRNGGTYIMYHGTSCSAANSIQSNGFLKSSGGMLGSCVYMSRDLQKTYYYASQKLPNSQTGCIVKATVNVGTVCTITTQNQYNQYTWMNSGCDSAWVPPNSYSLNPSGREESCIEDPNRITVVKVCSFSTVKATNKC